MKKRRHEDGKIRIIGGVWRGRKLIVADQPGLRPTPDRIRETLFNWLASIIPGARCLDLFSGTGALGFEALSRGALQVVMVEHNKQLVGLLEENKSALAAEHAEIINADALAWLGTANGQFDVVFLDPPFHKNIAQKTCELLINREYLSPSGYVYTETEQDATLNVAGLKTIKQAQAGQVKSMLHHYTPEISE